VTNPLHAVILIPVYRQTLYFAIDDNDDRFEAWLRTFFDDLVLHRDKTVNASAFMIDNGKLRHFAVRMKWWDADVPSVGRLSHECLHSAIQVLHYVGYTPKLKPRFSEPLTYLHETIFRACLDEINTWRSRQRAHRDRKDVLRVRKPVLGNAGVGRSRRTRRRTS